MSIKIPALANNRIKLFASKALPICPRKFRVPAILLLAGLVAGLSALFFSPRNGLAGPSGSKIVDQVDQLPRAVQRMRQAILQAAHGGQIDDMREVLQMNELMPLVDGQFVHDPVGQWKAASKHHGGHQILALLTKLLELPPVKKTTKNGTLYIWPYFAGVSLQRLAPPQIVQLYRLAPAQKAASMMADNRYSYGYVTIGPDGTWHGFGRAFDQLSR